MFPKHLDVAVQRKQSRLVLDANPYGVKLGRSHYGAIGLDVHSVGCNNNVFVWLDSSTLLGIQMDAHSIAVCCA